MVNIFRIGSIIIQQLTNLSEEHYEIIIIMLRSIVSRLFGEGRPRTNSVQDSFKHLQQPLKRQHSIDSKQKNNKIVQMQTDFRNKVTHNLIGHSDEILTVKKNVLSNDKSSMKNEAVNLDFISDIAQEDIELLPSYTVQEYNDHYQINTSVRASPKKSIKQLSFIDQTNSIRLQLTKHEQPTKSEMIKQQPKMLVQRQPSMRVIKKIEEQCSICRKPLKKADSLQLACTHRLHRGCAIKMEQRNSYKCDQCSNLKTAKRGSIVLISRTSRLFVN